MFMHSVISKKNNLSFLLIIFCLAFLFNSIIPERHFLPLILLSLLSLSNEIFNKKLMIIWLIYMIVIGTGYFYYFNFIYKTNVAVIDVSLF